MMSMCRMVEWGRYQATASVMMALLKMPAAWFQLSLLFLAPAVHFRCAQPTNQSVPLSNISEEIFDDSCYIRDEDDNLHSCHKFHYDRRDFANTVNMMWDLVCEGELLVTVAQVSFMFGVTFGNLLGGLMAGRVGRKPVLVVAILLMPLFSAIVAVVPTFPLFLLFRFLLGLSLGGTIVISFLLGGELVSGQWRAPVTILHQVPFGIGQSVFGLSAYFLRDWRVLQMALSIYCLIFFPYCWFVEESPQWLVGAGKLKRAERVTATILLKNGLRPSTLTELLPAADTQGGKAVAMGSHREPQGLCAVLRVPRLRRYVLSIWLTWYCAGLGFFGLNAYTPQWGGGAEGGIVNITVGGVVGGIPGNILTIFLVRRFGRKKVTIIAHLFVTLFAYLLPIYDVREQSGDWQRRLAGMCCLVAMSVAYPSLFLLSGELVPASVKLPVMVVANLMARLGNTTAPLVAGPAGLLHRCAPLWIIGSVALLSAALLLGLPETGDQPPPPCVLDILPPDRVPEVEMISSDEENKNKIYHPEGVSGS